MIRAVMLYAALFLVVRSVTPQESKLDPVWEPLRFLLGDWTGEGSGEPGQGSGSFSFRLELAQNILVRRNRADYPAKQGRPAFSHEDLMVVHKDPGTGRLQAIYFDGEGHVIHYGVHVSEDGKTVQFRSEVSDKTPQYRLTYAKSGNDTVRLKFEIAPAGKPESFSTYIEARARRSPVR